MGARWTFQELVERVLMCMWRLRRAYRVETSIYAQMFRELEGLEDLMLSQVTKDTRLGHIYEMDTPHDFAKEDDAGLTEKFEV